MPPRTSDTTLEQPAQQRTRNDQHCPVDGQDRRFEPVFEALSKRYRQADQSPDGCQSTYDEDPAQGALECCTSDEDQASEQESYAHHHVAEVFKRDEDTVRIILGEER